VLFTNQWIIIFRIIVKLKAYSSERYLVQRVLTIPSPDRRVECIVFGSLSSVNTIDKSLLHSSHVWRVFDCYALWSDKWFPALKPEGAGFNIHRNIQGHNAGGCVHNLRFLFYRFSRR
jgi:hypothetical protein